MLEFLALAILWTITGAGLLAAIDSDGRLLGWAASGPFGSLGVGAVICLWPIVAVAFLAGGKVRDAE
jgi:hypothetical protein